nr:hypothetical protein [Sicyoidochytrium minutum DNA virus]
MPAADRPRRENVNKPKDLYVPDESTFDDDLSVDSDLDLDDEDSDLEDASINTDDSDEVVTKSGNDDEYENDSFVVPDDEEEEISDGSYSDSEGSFIEESETGSDYESDSMDVDDANPIEPGEELNEAEASLNLGKTLLDVFKEGFQETIDAQSEEEKTNMQQTFNLLQDTFKMFGKIGSENFEEECDAYTERTAKVFETIREKSVSGKNTDVPPETSANLFKGFFKFMNFATQAAQEKKDPDPMEADENDTKP